MISATVLTKNCEKSLRRTLDSLAWVSEVVVLDTGSSDQTRSIASRYPNVALYQEDFTSFGALHNRMAALASNDWILSVDSDESLSLELINELQALDRDPNCVYSMPRHNYFNDKWIRGCGWYPDRVLRLYHRGQTRFSSDLVHERLITEGVKEVALSASIRHDSYTCLADFLTKMQLYSDLFAKQHCGKRSSSLLRAIAAKWVAFFRTYVLKRGFRDGYEGWVIASYNAQTAYYKYLKLREVNLGQKTTMTRGEGQILHAIEADPESTFDS